MDPRVKATAGGEDDVKFGRSIPAHSCSGGYQALTLQSQHWDGEAYLGIKEYGAVVISLHSVQADIELWPFKVKAWTGATYDRE